MSAVPASVTVQGTVWRVIAHLVPVTEDGVATGAGRLLARREADGCLGLFAPDASGAQAPIGSTGHPDKMLELAWRVAAGEALASWPDAAQVLAMLMLGAMVDVAPAAATAQADADLRAAVRAMRHCQTRYFKTRERSDLIASREAEAAVDRLIGGDA